jgi:ABC-type uncharacterized transport system substrate-binding protein
MPLTTYIAGEVLTAASLNANFTFAAANPTSKIAQVLSTTKSDTFTSSSTSFIDVTGLSVSITPTLATSKIMVFASVMMSVNGSNFMRLVRGSTAISIGDAGGSRVRASASSAAVNSTSIIPYNVMFLDSPATTSATTYKIQIQTYSPAMFVNYTYLDDDATYCGRVASNITVMEILA